MTAADTFDREPGGTRAAPGRGRFSPSTTEASTSKVEMMTIFWSRWLRTTLVVLASAVSFLTPLGCGGDNVPQVSPTSEQYKEAKKRGDEVRAKEYGRKSLDEPKAKAAAGKQR